MKLAAMQPYFFPYVGYFDLIRQVDRWVIFDTPQYIRHGWINRNRILHPRQGWQYILVPIRKHARSTPIEEIRIQENSDWRARILGQMKHYQHHASRYASVMALLQRCFDITTDSISVLNEHILSTICEYLSIPFPAVRWSALQTRLSIRPVTDPGEWGLHISEAIGADEYVNGPGGRELFSPEAFAAHGIRLTIREREEFVPSAPPIRFIPNLSILDSLMWSSPEEIVSYLDQPPKVLQGCP